MTPTAALAFLQKAADVETVRGLAKRLDIDAGYLCHVLKGRKDPQHVLRRFGFEKVTTYRFKAEGLVVTEEQGSRSEREEPIFSRLAEIEG